MPDRQRRLLCLSTYPMDDASVRLRFLAYVPALEAAGWSVRFESVVSPRLFSIKNRGGRLIAVGKAVLLIAGLLRRLVVFASAGRYQTVWIHREAFPFFTPVGERLLRRLTRARIVLDFDDALFEPPPTGRDWRSRFRRPDGFTTVVALADQVITGSPYLRDWAEPRASGLSMVPTCVDTEALREVRDSHGDVVTIGWIGSWSTTESLLAIAPVLRRMVERGDVRVLCIGADNLRLVEREIPGAQWRRWDRGREASDLSQFDVGLMPVQDTPWNRGKCAFKLIQYMAVGIPFVASPVGMNVDLATASGGGLLCTTDEEWTSALTRLVEDRPLRERLGTAGRHHAVERFDYRIYVPDIVAAVGSHGPAS